MAYTSIQTTGGWADNAVAATAYNLIFDWALKARPVCYPLVDVQPKNVPHRGASVTMELNNYFDESVVVAGKTTLNEETDITPTKLPATRKVVLTPQEKGQGVSRTLKLSNRGLVPIDPVIGKAVGQLGSDVIDALVQDAMRGATNKVYGGGKTATNLLTAADTVKAADVRKVVTKLRGASVETKDGQFYVGVFHPDAIHDLRSETGSGSWRVPNEYGTDQNKIWNGEFGEFEGVRFIQTPTVLRGADAGTGAGTAPNRPAVYHNFIMGAEALAKAEITPLQSVVAPVVDSLRRFAGLGWYADLDFQIYRPEAIWEVQAASSLGSLS